MVMSLYAFRSSALLNPDPYDACFWGATEHPRYHDCENCDHAKYGGCKYGTARLEKLKFNARMKEMDGMVADIDAFCKTTYYPPAPIEITPAMKKYLEEVNREHA